MSSVPKTTEHIARTFLDVRNLLNRTHQHLNATLDDANEVIPSCSLSQYDTMIRVRDALVPIMGDLGCAMGGKAWQLVEELASSESSCDSIK